MNLSEIPVVISLITKEVRKFRNPIVTEIGKGRKSPFHVLISCLLSLRTKDATTAKASQRLFDLADTPEEMEKLTTKQIEKAIYPAGFYRVKARRIKEICRTLLEKYGGKVPDNFEKLMELKGVGRKTASIVMCYGFNKAGYIAVDTHVHRIPNRLGWVNTKTPEQTEQELKKIVPQNYWRDLNNTFVIFGQNICRPVRPHCWECPVAKHCEYYRRVYLPSLKQKPNKKS